MVLSPNRPLCYRYLQLFFWQCCHLAFFLLINQKRYLTILDLQNLAREFAMTHIKFWPRGRSPLHLLGSQPHLHHIGLFGWGDIRRIWPLLDMVPVWLKKSISKWAGLCWQHTTQRYVCLSIRRITGSLVNFQRHYICVSPQFWALSAISCRFHLLKGHKSWSPTRLSFHFMQSAAVSFKPSMFSCILLSRGINYKTKSHYWLCCDYLILGESLLTFLSHPLIFIWKWNLTILPHRGRLNGGVGRVRVSAKGPDNEVS